MTFAEAWNKVQRWRNPDLPQDRAELEWLFRQIEASGARTYVEIGSRSGGSLYVLSQALPEGSLVVSVDMPEGPWGRSGSLGSLRRVVSEIEGRDVRLVLGDSGAPGTVAQVEALCLAAQGPVAVFIDGDHSYNGVRTDWYAYRALWGCSLVMFHDIAPRKSKVEVPRLWAELCLTYRTEQFIDSGKYGVGAVHLE